MTTTSGQLQCHVTVVTMSLGDRNFSTSLLSYGTAILCGLSLTEHCFEVGDCVINIPDWLKAEEFRNYPLKKGKKETKNQAESIS